MVCGMVPGTIGLFCTRYHFDFLGIFLLFVDFFQIFFCCGAKDYMII